MPRPTLDDAAQDALHHQDALEAHLRAMLADGHLDPDGGPRLEALRVARDAAALTLGLALLAQLRVGAEVAVSPGVEEAVRAAPADVCPEPVSCARDEATPAGDLDAPSEPTSAPQPVAVEPSEPPAPASTPSSPRASVRELEELRSRFNEGDATLARPARSVPVEPYLACVAVVPPLKLAKEREDEHARLDDLSQRIDVLVGAPREVQRTALGLLTARARRLQDSPLGASGLEGIFRRLSAWSESARPGWVHGLAREHRPRSGDWEADARVWLAELRADAGMRQATGGEALLRRLRADLHAGAVDEEALVGRFEAVVGAGIASTNVLLLTLAEPHLGLIERSGRCKTLRKHLHARAAKGRLGEAESEAGAVAAVVTPAILEATRGRVAVVVGGDERGEALARIHAAFGFSEVTWERGWHMRRIQALRDRVSRGSVDCVIYLRRYMNHALSNVLVPACDDAGALQVWVDQGYGVTAVQRALSRALGLEGRLAAK